jgi:hypothetical protein
MVMTDAPSLKRTKYTPWTVHINLTERQHGKLKRLAKRDGRTVSGLGLMLLTEALAGLPNPRKGMSNG